jgi:hypothetical protein
MSSFDRDISKNSLAKIEDEVFSRYKRLVNL